MRASFRALTISRRECAKASVHCDENLYLPRKFESISWLRLVDLDNSKWSHNSIINSVTAASVLFSRAFCSFQMSEMADGEKPSAPTLDGCDYARAAKWASSPLSELLSDEKGMQLLEVPKWQQLRPTVFFPIKPSGSPIVHKTS